MDTKEKLLKAFEQFRPHINGHKTAIDLFFEGIKEVEDLQEQVKNCSIPDVVGRSEQLVCPNCDGEGFSGKGTNEILPCLSCFGSGERAD